MADNVFNAYNVPSRRHGGFINDWAFKREHEQEQEKQRAREFKALAEYGEAAGLLTKDQAQVMDLDSLRGHVEGAIFKQKLSEAQEMQALRKAQLQDYLARTELSNRTASDFSGYMRELGGAMQMPPTDARLSDYYDTDSREMPARPVRGFAEYGPELSAKYPLAAALPQLNDYIKQMQPAGGGERWQLRPDSVSDVGGIKRIAVSPNSFQVITPEKPGKETAGNYPWLLSDDEDEFKAGIKKIEDPAERDRALAARTLYNRALGKADPLAELLGELSGARGAKSSAPTKVTTQKQFDALPKGAEYIGKDGRKYRKP
jgi:hypothetical protein